MKRLSLLLVVGALLALVLAPSACDEDECCPVSEQGTCTNFSAGGARSLRLDGVCPTPITDNIPMMTGKKVDAKGCTYWERSPSGGLACGVARPPGKDAALPESRDASDDSDASNDAGDAGQDADASDAAPE